MFQANYATALLLDGNTDGFFGILGGIRERTHPAVARLDDAIRRWKAGMTFWQRVASALGVGGRGSPSTSRPANCDRCRAGGVVAFDLRRATSRRG